MEMIQQQPRLGLGQRVIKRQITDLILGPLALVMSLKMAT